MAEGVKPYRRYRGGRVKGRVPLDEAKRAPAKPAKTRPQGPAPLGPLDRARPRRAPALLPRLGLLGYLSFSRGVDEANERLPRRAYDRLAEHDGSILSDPATILVIGTDGGSAPGRGDSNRSDSLMLLRTDPEHAPALVPLDPARPPRRHPRLRLVEGQRREPVRRARADDRDRAAVHRPPDPPRHRPQLRRLQGADRRAWAASRSTCRRRSSRTSSTARTRPRAAPSGTGGASRRGRRRWTGGARSSTRACARTSSTRPTTTSPAAGASRRSRTRSETRSRASGRSSSSRSSATPSRRR